MDRLIRADDMEYDPIVEYALEGDEWRLVSVFRHYDGFKKEEEIQVEEREFVDWWARGLVERGYGTKGTFKVNIKEL